MVEREASPTDRRLVYALLKASGPEAVSRGLEIFNATANEYFAECMNKDEIKKITSGLGKIISSCQPGMESRRARTVS